MADLGNAFFVYLKDIYARVPSWVIVLCSRTILNLILFYFGFTILVYHYAYTNGARIPLEGIEFTLLSQFLLSFVLALLSLSTLLLKYALPDYGSRLPRPITRIFDIYKVFVQKNNEIIQELAKYCFVTMIVFSMLLFAISHYFALENIRFNTLFFIGTAVGIIAVSGIVILSSKLRLRHLSTILYFVGFAFLVFFLAPVFPKLLQQMRYGGGMNVEINYSLAGKKVSQLGGLFLLTKEYVILEEVACPVEIKAPCFLEIKRNTVVNIVYHGGKNE